MINIIRENLISPGTLAKRHKDSWGKTIFLFLFFVVLLSLNGVIDSITNMGLSNLEKELIQDSLGSSFENIPCDIDNGLVCSEDGVYIVETGFLDIVFDPTNDYLVESGTLTMVLKESEVKYYSLGQPLATTDYQTEMLLWSSEWNNISIDPSSDEFWDSLFAGIDSFMENNRTIWLTSNILVIIVNVLIILLIDILLDTFILNLFRISKYGFGGTLKIVINASTMYVIIKTIIALYGIPTNGIIDYIIQLQPLIYALIALRYPKGRVN